ncbi:MAG: hypothetical protein KGD60_09915, partial [Candidatus Thorarchaeota archaeon]|nr:hypothetical protein [Candidatus Thorarchaeota archaeon]
MKRGRLVVAIVFIILACGSFSSFGFDLNNEGLGLASEMMYDASKFDPVDTRLISDQSELQGTLNPVVIEQTGNKTTSTIHAETDSNTNVETNLVIDTVNDWFGSQASVNLWNLNRLYV